jgi:hypothetical protein
MLEVRTYPFVQVGKMQFEYSSLCGILKYEAAKIPQMQVDGRKDPG